MGFRNGRGGGRVVAPLAGCAGARDGVRLPGAVEANAGGVGTGSIPVVGNVRGGEE